MSNKSITASILWDRLGIGVSGICAIHCLVFPIFISTMPLWSFANFLHDWAHPIFIILLAPTVYYASKRSHFDTTIVSMLVAGFLAILFGWLLGHFWLGFFFETILTVFGSGILISGHWFNYRHHQTCSNKNHKHHPVTNKKNHEKA